MSQYTKSALLVLVLLLLVGTAAALPVIAHDTVRGEVYVDSTANWYSKNSTNNFDVPDGTVIFAKYYVGIWCAAPPIYTTFNGHAFPASPSCYSSDMGVTWIPYNVTDYIVPGETNTATIDSTSGGDGRQYGSTLVVVLQNESKSRAEYWVAEGLDWMHYDDYVGYGVDNSTTYFNGTIDLDEVNSASLYSTHLTGYNYEDFNGNSLSGAADSASGEYFNYIRWDNVKDSLVAENQTVNVGRGGDNYCSVVLHGLTIEYDTVDLVPLSLTPMYVTAGTVNTMTATVRNSGNIDASAFNVSLMADRKFVDTQTVSGLAAGGSTSVDLHWTPDGTVYAYTMTVVVDPENAVDEIEESNNMLDTRVGTTSAPVPVAEFSGTPACGDAPLTVNFMDESTNLPLLWAWDFDNDGIIDSNDQHPTHTYNVPGTYTVNLTVSNGGGSNSTVKTDYIIVTTPVVPVANFTATPVRGDTPLTVSFTDQSVNSPRSWAWDFDNDGIVDSTEQNPSHTYTSAGIYAVNLTATNAAGSDYETKADYITVAGTTPLAAFTATPPSGPAPLTVQFTDQSAYDPVSWAWDFDNDGTEDSTLQNPSYTFMAPGVYSVKLTAANSHGSDDEVKTGYIIVTNTTAPLAAFTATPTSGIAPLTVQFADQSSSSGSSERIVNGGFEAGSSGWTISRSLGTVRMRNSVANIEMEADGYIGSGAANISQDVDLTNANSLKFSYCYGEELMGGGYSAVKVFIGDDVVWQKAYNDNKWRTVTIDTSSYTGMQTVTFSLIGTELDGPGGVNLVLDGISAIGTNSTTSWAWDFENDGSIDSTDPNPEYTYETAGNYSVNLTITTAAGSDSEVKNNYISISEAPQGVDLIIGGIVNPVPASAVFAKDSNPVKIQKVTNSGPADASNITVALYASDVSNGTVAINSTVVSSLSGGEQTDVILIDPTIRDLEGGTVTYTAVLDPENLIVETDESNNNKTSPVKNVRYNGYKGKGLYWEGGSNITTQHTYDLRGDIVSSTQPESAYKSVGWTDRTETWTAGDLPVPDGATVEKAWLYVSYNWDQTPGGLPNLTATFNDNTLALGTPYMDKSNFGAFADYEYGLYVVNVTSFLVRDGDNILVTMPNTGNKNALYPSTLAVIYSDPTATRKQIFINEECDELGYSESGYGTTMEEATAYAPFTGMEIDPAGVRSATLYSFVGSAGPDEGNLIFNGNVVATNAWHGTLNTASAQTFDVTGLLNATGNEAAVQGTTSGGMAALQQVLVVEYTEPAAPDLTISTLAPNKNEIFSAGENTYSTKITNIGTADAGAFAAEFNVSGVIGTVAVPDGLPAGANVTLTWTDGTVRAAGEPATFTVTADAEDVISESNEENNIRTIEKTVVDNGYRGKRWTDGDDLTTAATYTVRGDLAYSSGDSAYLSAKSNWKAYTANWTADDLSIPENATVTAARLYVPYTWDKGPVFPDAVELTFNDVAVEKAAFYADEKLWGSSYPYGMTVYDVKDAFNKDANAAVLTSTFPGGGNVSVRGMVLAVVYDDRVTAPHTIVINEGFDLLYGGSGQATTPDEATAYAPFTIDTADALNATLVALAPGAGPNEGELIFNDEVWTDAWNSTGQSQIGAAERDVTSLLSAEGNVAAFRSSADYMEAAAAFLVMTYPVPTGCIAVTSTPEGATIFLDGEDTGLVTPATLEEIPVGEHVVTLKRDDYADASATVTVVEDETATVDLTLTTLTSSLAVTSTPDGASIFIDGADTGETTDTTLEGIAVGDHTVTLKMEGYREAATDVTIMENETAIAHLDLEEAVGCIAVTSTPEGATIFLDDVDTGETTDALLEDIAIGEHTITVTKSGYMDASTTVTVVDNETISVEFTLAEPSGSIAVTSSPDGARIFLDGEDTGEQTNTTLTNIPVGEHLVTVSLDGYLEAEETVTVFEGESVAVHFDPAPTSITLLPGWNFVSTPKTLAPGHDTIAVFDEVDTADHSVLLYNGTARWEAMSSEEAFRPLDGIWIYANSTYNIPLVFDTGGIATPPEKTLDEGWNAIGFTDTIAEPAANTLRSIENCWATVIGFDAGAQEYETSIIRGAEGRHGEMRTMEPMNGYWLYMSDAAELCAIGA
ncbi:DUF3344 domain-containing protein [Methanofollis aquaemaris]|uniref:DUF3344 domain-containing protein n=1 Tax=Methanofollis aquaemaris TaxID=126734 RepID=A0A8A3S4B4_9EURY|nr:DUF3344 domain-containing protein [Methanofollis aquaemaris]QSZ66965.1 DUF3344 domain-containing protein [Methanofollis aquaemaris]